MPPVKGFRIPDWANPDNASVLDSPLQKAARTIGQFLGINDPVGQVMAVGMPVEMPKPGQNLGAELVAEYGGAHRPPMADNGAPLHDLTGAGRIYPDDVYSQHGPRYYGTGRAEDLPLFAKIHSLRDKPDAMVTIYRAVPKAASDDIRHGDWVTISRQYAKDHGDAWLKGDYKIISGKVPAKTLFTNGDSPYEYGLDLSMLTPK